MKIGQNNLKYTTFFQIEMTILSKLNIRKISEILLLRKYAKHVCTAPFENEQVSDSH